jgi:hypothetical protein
VEDILSSTKKLRVLGTAFTVIPLASGRYLVQSVPGELSQDQVRPLTQIPELWIRIHVIRIQHFRLNTDPDPNPIRIRIQSGSRALMTKNWKKNWLKKFFFDQNLHFTYPEASIKNVQVTEEALSSQKRPSNTSKHEIF